MGAPFRKRECAGGGSLPRPTGLAKERKASQVAAWVRLGLRSTSFATNLVLIDHGTDHFLHAPDAAPGQQRNCNFQARQAETADDWHGCGVVPPPPRSAHPYTHTAAGFANSSGLEKQERRNRRRLRWRVCPVPLTAAETSTMRPCLSWTTQPPSPRGALV